MSMERAKKRGFIRFQPKRPPLTREQFLYWSDFLPKVIKIGTEFEIELPSPRHTLQVKEELPCIRADQACATDCANLERCLVDRHPSLCLTRNTGRFLGEAFVCPAKNNGDLAACETCPAWVLDCKSTNCSMFTSYCLSCPSFERLGSTPENADIRRSPEAIRSEMQELLQPTGFVGRTGKRGVLEVKKEGSLPNGGIEVPTVGRRVHWNSFYQMCKGIIDPIVERGGFVNERCGQHYHVLAGYLKDGSRHGSISELEEPLPEVILANLHQLNRRYELAMFWITSCGTSLNSITRWARFRQSIFKYSALRNKMRRVQDELARDILCMNNGQRGKYASVAYHFCEFSEEGDVSTFHIENRIADAALSPAVVTAWAMLYYALTLKAVRLSQYGIMEVGDKAYIERIHDIQSRLIDGERREFGENRKADTSLLLEEHRSWLRENAKEMVGFLKPELYNMGPSYDILMSLADKPCSIRLIEGRNWQDIERELMQGMQRPETSFEEEVREVVDLAGVVDCADLENWVEEVAAYLGQDPNDVATTVNQLLQSGRYRWSAPIGALITS